jgi:hypothetical protein
MLSQINAVYTLLAYLRYSLISFALCLDLPSGSFLPSWHNKTLHAFLIGTSVLRSNEGGKPVNIAQNFFIIWLQINVVKLLLIVTDCGPHPLVTSSSKSKKNNSAA